MPFNMKPEIKHEYMLKLVHKEQAAKKLYSLSFAVPPQLQQSFQRPGQYISLKVEETQSFYAMAHSPLPLPSMKALLGASETFLERQHSSPEKNQEPLWEFLIKNDKNAENRTSQALCALKENDSVAASSVMGKGFALEQAFLLESSEKSKSLHLFAMGSGIAPLRSVLLYILAHRRDPKVQKLPKILEPKITLWQAAFSKEYLAYTEEYTDWCQKGIKLKLCLDGSERVESFEGASESVSIEVNSKNPIELLAAKRPDLSSSIVCWAGSEEFGCALQELCLELALPKEALLDNFKQI